MSSKVLISFSIATVLLSIGAIAHLSYIWSFTETNFSGYLGIAIPVFSAALCAYAGYVIGTFSKESS